MRATSYILSSVLFQSFSKELIAFTPLTPMNYLLNTFFSNSDQISVFLPEGVDKWTAIFFFPPSNRQVKEN